MTKPEPEWMPSGGEINEERMRDTELFGSYTPQVRLRNLIRRTAIKAQIAVLSDRIAKFCWECAVGDAPTRLNLATSLWRHDGDECTCAASPLHSKIDSLRADLAEMEEA